MTTPAGHDTRPTSEKVREAIFSMLTSMDLIEGASVLDLFSGSGALGVEALSRGAASVTFVDSGASALQAVRANLDVIAERRNDAVVVRSDAARFLVAAGYFDVIFADPPYRFEAWAELLVSMAPHAGTLVAESDHPLEVGPAWETVKVRKYGGTVVTVAQPVTHTGDPVREEGEI